jgi:hypothetical protein
MIKPVGGLEKYLKHPEGNTIIWRYIDMVKFMSMLESSSLFFSSLGSMEDKFEGSFSSASKKSLERERLLDKHKTLDFSSISAEQRRENQSKADEFYSNWATFAKENYLVSCWNSEECESYLLWKCYSSISFGICLKTTVGDFESALQSDKVIFCHEVGYLRNDQINFSGQLLSIAFSKREFYSGEKEIRFVVEKDSNAKKPNHINVDLSKLINTIVLSPKSPDWFGSLVKEICDRYDLKCRIEKSSIILPS